MSWPSANVAKEPVEAARWRRGFWAVRKERDAFAQVALGAAWSTAVGEVVASRAQPVAYDNGVVTVSCESAVWAEELALIASDIRTRLNGALHSDVVRDVHFFARAA